MKRNFFSVALTYVLTAWVGIFAQSLVSTSSLIEEGKYEDALADCESLIRSSTDAKVVEEAEFSVARCYFELNQLENFDLAKNAFLLKYPASEFKDDFDYYEKLKPLKGSDWNSLSIGMSQFIAAYENSSKIPDAEYFLAISYRFMDKKDDFINSADTFLAEHADHPEADNIAFHRAYIDFEDNKWEQSKNAFTKIVKDFPSSHLIKDAAFYELMSLWNMNQYDQYSAQYDLYKNTMNVLPSDQARADALSFNKAMVPVNKKDWTAAIIELDQFLAEHQNAECSVDAEYNKLMCQRNAARNDDFKESADKFIQNNPDYKDIADVVYQKSYLYYEEGRWSEAAVYFKEFKNTYPASHLVEDAAFYQAMSHWNRGDYDKYDSELEKFKASFPDYKEKNAKYETLDYCEAAIPYNKQDWAKASETFATFVANSKNNELKAQACYRQSECLWNDRKYAEYEQLINEINQNGLPIEDSDNLEYMMAHAYFKQGMWEKATAAFEAFQLKYPVSHRNISAKLYLAASQQLLIDDHVITDEKAIRDMKLSINESMESFRENAMALINMPETPDHVKNRLRYEYVESYHFERDYAGLETAAQDLMSAAREGTLQFNVGKMWVAIAKINNEGAGSAVAMQYFDDLRYLTDTKEEMAVEIKNVALFWRAQIAKVNNDQEVLDSCVAQIELMPEIPLKEVLVSKFVN